jgi:hypothetical protein
MRYVDYLLASILLITAIVFILVMEITHPRGAILDIPFLWLVIAMINFVRLGNADIPVRGLRISCIGANLIGFMLEAVRFRLFGLPVLHDWGPYTVIAGIAIFGEVILSMIQKNGSGSPARV